MTGGLFAVLDDIAVLLDDAAVMSKIAAKKTAGILGDDLAVNAEKATGFRASRELPVLWAITKGSIVNKLIILPIAFLLSAFIPWLIIPVLLLGGVYLSFEGVEKIYHVIGRHPSEKPAAETVTDNTELLKIEKKKIQSAVRTDFILSIEIIMIALGTVVGESIVLQVVVVSIIALVATIGVYGLVALLVRMDDAGFFLIDKSFEFKGIVATSVKTSGAVLVAALPKVIRILGIVGTIAMLLVGGGMFTHNIEVIHHLVASYPPLLADFVIGLIVGAVALTVEMQVVRVFRPNVN